MIRDIRRHYFEVWGNEEAQNTFLKGILAILGSLFIIQSVVLCIVSLRKPILVAVGAEETRVLTLTPPHEELLTNELNRLVRRYVETHYNWDSSTVEKAHEQASHFVAEEFAKAFKAANLEQIKFAKDKRLSQKVYVYDLSVDSKALTVKVSMDRILTVEGLRTSSTLILNIRFENGPRTPGNPEGIYIADEKVVNS